MRNLFSILCGYYARFIAKSLLLFLHSSIATPQANGVFYHRKNSVNQAKPLHKITKKLNNKSLISKEFLFETDYKKVQFLIALPRQDAYFCGLNLVVSKIA